MAKSAKWSAFDTAFHCKTEASRLIVMKLNQISALMLVVLLAAPGMVHSASAAKAIRPNQLEVQRAIACINRSREYADLKNFGDAIAEQRKAIDIRKQVYGHWHKDTVKCYRNLGWLCLQAGDFSAAVAAYQECLAVDARKTAEKKFEVLILCDFAWTLHASGQYADALVVYSRLLNDTTIGQDRYLAIVEDALKLIDDMLVDGKVSLDSRKDCWDLLSGIRNWAKSRDQSELMFEAIGSQARLYAFFGMYARAAKLLEDAMLSASTNNAYSVDHYSCIVLQQSQLALITGGYQTALESLKTLSTTYPNIKTSLDFQIIQLQVYVASGDTRNVTLAIRPIQIAMQNAAYPVTGGLVVPKAYLAIGNYQEATTACQQILQSQLSQIDKSRTYLLLSDIYRASLDPKRAQAELLNAINAWGAESHVPSAYLVQIRQRQAQLYFDLGESEKARALLLESVDYCRRESSRDPLELARSLANLGECERELGLYKEAEGSFLEAEKLFVRLLGESHPQVYQVRRGLAGVFQALGVYAKAEALYLRELAQLGKSGNPYEIASAQQALAEVYVFMGDYQRADENWRPAQKALKSLTGGKGDAYIRACLTVGTLAYAMGDFQTSEQALRAAIATLDQMEHPPRWLPLQVTLALGNNYAKRFRLADATRQYDSVLGEVATSCAHSRLARRLNADALLGLCNIARKQRANLPQARKYAAEAVELYAQCLGDSHPLLATAYEELGSCCQADDDHATAAAAFETCRQIRESLYGRAHPAVLRVTNNLAAVAIAEAVEIDDPDARLTKYKTACGSLADGIHAFENKYGQSQLDTPVVCKAHANLALIHSVQGEVDNALKDYDTSLRGYLAYTRRNLIGLDEREQIAFLQGELQPALHAAYAFAVTNRENQAVCRAAAEWSANFKGLSQEITATAHLLSKSEPGNQRQLADVLNELGRVNVQIARGDLPADAAIVKTLDQRRAELLRQQTADGSAHRIWDEHAKPTHEWVTVADLEKRLGSNGLLVDYFTYWSYNPATKKWSKRAGALAVSSHPDENVLLDDLGELADLIAKLGAARNAVKNMENTEGELYQEWDNASPTSPDGKRQILARLKEELRPIYDKTLQFCDDRIEKSTQIFLCPDDDLWFVPWACLPNEESFLAERHTLTLLSSGRTLACDASSSAPFDTAVIFANPAFSLEYATEPAPTTSAPIALVAAAAPSGSGGIAVVSGQQNHVDSVAATTADNARMSKKQYSKPLHQFEPVDVTGKVTEIEDQLKQNPAMKVDRFDADNATEKSFMAVNRPKYIVFVTHGVYEPPKHDDTADQRDPPWSDWREHELDIASTPLARCGLALAGVNRREHAEVEGEDGYLSGIEIIASDLRGTDLVFLSACETGLGDKRCGEAVAGLYQSFELAGARNVIGTLWQVDGQAAAEFTKEFWKYVAQGDPHATALHKTQLAFLKHERYSHPYYWAAFGLVHRN